MDIIIPPSYRHPGEGMVLFRSVEVHLFEESNRLREAGGQGNQS
jgi:hypothetical protein